MKEEEATLTIYADGGARGNPGEAAYGFVIYDWRGSKIYEEGKRLGVQTNNFAEYSAVVAALKYVLSIKYKVLRINFFLDSQLVAMQLSGKWKIKNEILRNLYFTTRELEQKIGGHFLYQHVLRDKNQDADRLVNLALDNKS